MRIRVALIGLLLITMLLSSCKLMYRTLLGVDTQPDFMSYRELDKKSRRYGVEQSANFYLEVDNGYYDAVQEYHFDQLSKIDTVNDTLEMARLMVNVKNDMQPVQLRYFDTSGKSIFKMVNCYLDPPIPMDWNVQGSLDQFPPKTPAIPSLQKDVNQDLNFFLPYIKTQSGEPLRMEALPAADYYVVVFWNSFFIRPSKKLIKQVKRYHKEHKEERIHTIYVNNHNAHIWGYLTDKQKEIVKAQINTEK